MGRHNMMQSPYVLAFLQLLALLAAVGILILLVFLSILFAEWMWGIAEFALFIDCGLVALGGLYLVLVQENKDHRKW